MRHRPTERKAVIDLLHEEWDDTGELAEAILDKLLALKWARGGWIIVHREGFATPAYFAYGPYDTRNQAERDIGKRIVACSPGAKAMPLRVVNLDAREPADPTLF